MRNGNIPKRFTPEISNANTPAVKPAIWIVESTKDSVAKIFFFCGGKHKHESITNENN